MTTEDDHDDYDGDDDHGGARTRSRYYGYVTIRLLCSLYSFIVACVQYPIPSLQRNSIQFPIPNGNISMVPLYYYCYYCSGNGIVVL